MLSQSTFWERLLAPDQTWKVAYPKVAGHVRRYLEANVVRPATIDTTTLAERLFAKENATTEAGKAARIRLFAALQALARHDLADCVSKGEPRKGSFGKMGRPTLWGAPSDVSEL